MSRTISGLVNSIISPIIYLPMTLYNLGVSLSVSLQSTTLTANRIQTLQDATDTFIYRNTTDTLTNKTLTNPTINTVQIATFTRNTYTNQAVSGPLTSSTFTYTLERQNNVVRCMITTDLNGTATSASILLFTVASGYFPTVSTTIYFTVSIINNGVNIPSNGYVDNSGVVHILNNGGNFTNAALCGVRQQVIQWYVD